MKVALFKNKHSSFTHGTPGSELLESVTTFVRISEYVEVEFPSLAQPTAEEQMESLAREDQELFARYQSQRAAIGKRRAALTAQSDKAYDGGPECSCGAKAACRCGPIVANE